MTAGKSRIIKYSFVIALLLTVFLYGNMRVTQASAGMDAFRVMFYALSAVMTCFVCFSFFLFEHGNKKQTNTLNKKCEKTEESQSNCGYRRSYTKKIEIFFIVSTLVLGIVYDFMIPVMSAPDESMHLNFAYELSERMLGWDTQDDWTTKVFTEEETQAGLFKDGIVHEYYNRYFFSLLGHTDAIKTDEAAAHDASTVLVVTDSGYAYNTEVPKLCYLPSALGLSLGRVLGLGAVRTLLLGRLFNLAVFLILGYLAVECMPFKKELLVAITMLPMTIQEVNSFSCDSMILGLAFLYTAIILKLVVSVSSYPTDRVEIATSYSADYAENASGNVAFARRKSSNEYVALFLLAVVIAYFLSWCKYGACMPLCMLLLLPALACERKAIKKNIIRMSACGVLVCIIGAFLPSMYFLFSTETLSNSASAYYTVSDVLGDLPHTFLLLGNTICRYMDHYLYSLVGTSLGYFEINYPVHLGLLLLVFVVLISLSGKNDKAEDDSLGETTSDGKRTLACKAKKGHFLIIFVCLAGAAFAVGGMIIGCTPAGSDVIEGVQGRYFLPYLLAMMMLFESKRLTAVDGEALRAHCLEGMAAVQFVIVVCLFIRAF